MSTKNALAAALLALLICRPAAGQAHLPFSLSVPIGDVAAYDGAVPAPESVIGHRIGTRHTEPHQIVEYFRAVAAASDRVALETHARSYEGRPLIHAVVTAAELHGRLEEIRQANLRVSDDPEAVSDEEITDMPAIVYAGYSIHGNEASGSEAAILLLYHLAAGHGGDVDEVLRNTVVLIDPMFNPDGRGRFTTWVNRNRGGVSVTDPNDREHVEPWPGGRTNHYWFDLNRDWLLAQHPESQGRLQVFHAWRPQVVTDHHEMNEDRTFFFQPGIPSRNHPNTPERTFELTARLGAYHGRALDRIGSLYYTSESYDDFYIGKGSTYPDVNGAVGILFEQASSRALEREVPGDTLTYAFTVRNQFVTSLSTLAGTVAMREELIRHQRDFYAGAGSFAREAQTSAYVIDAASAPSRTEELLRLLSRHRVGAYELSRNVSLEGRTFEAGRSVIVPLDQPQARFIKSALERTTSFEDSLFYDVSAWTLPLAFGVPYGEMTTDASGYVGAPIDAYGAPDARVVGGRSDYAYVVEWGTYFAPRALHALQRRGVRTRVMTDPITVDVEGRPHTFGRGSIVVPVRQAGVTSDDLYAHVQAAAEENAAPTYAVDAGLTVEGPDLGSPAVPLLEPPRAALVTGAGTSAYNAGEVWHLLTERFGVPISLVDAGAVGELNLDRYSTIVMAGGSYEGLDAAPIVEWVHAGGHLIGLQDAPAWVVDNGLLDLEEKTIDLDTLYASMPFEALSRARGAQGIGGAILEIDLDTTHPIGYGYEEAVPVFRRGTTFYRPPDQPGSSVARYSAAPLLGGYVSKEMIAEAAESASIAAGGSGRGRVTLFMDNPNFRAFWYGTNGLFLNALFFGALY